MALGPLSVGLLMPIVGWRVVYLMWVAPFLFYIPTFVTNRSSVGALQRDVSPTLKPRLGFLTKAFLLLIVVESSVAMGRQAISTYLSAYLVLERGTSAATAALILGIFSIIGIGAGPIGGFIADRFGERGWLTITYTISIVSLLAVIYAQLFTALLTALLIYGFFIGAEFTITTSLVAHYTPKDRRGAAYGTFLLPTYLTGASAPILAAYIAERTSISSIFPLSISFLLTALLTLRMLPRPSKLGLS